MTPANGNQTTDNSQPFDSAQDKQTTSNAPDVTPTIKPPPSVPASTPTSPSPTPNVIPPVVPTSTPPPITPPISIPPPPAPIIQPTPPVPPAVPPSGTASKPFVPPGGTQDKPPASVTSATPPHKKFPFMMVTLFVTVILAGLGGSFLFFTYSNASVPKKTPQILITPPITIAPTTTTVPANPFESGTENLTANPFASPTAVTNPFGTYQNPFTGATVSATPQAAQNPFK